MSKLDDCLRKAKQLPLEIKTALRQGTQELTSKSDISELDAAKTVVQQFLDVTQRDIKTVSDALKEVAEPKVRYATETEKATAEKPPAEPPSEPKPKVSPDEKFTPPGFTLRRWSLSRLFKGPIDRLKETSESSKPFGVAYESYEDDLARFNGQDTAPWRHKANKLNNDQKQKIADYGEALRYERHDDAKKLYDSADDATKEAIDLMDDQKQSRFEQLKEAGVKVEDSVTKKPRPIGQKDNYVPLMKKQSTLDMLANPQKHVKEYNQWVHDMINGGFAKDKADAERIFGEHQRRQYGESKFSPIETSYQPKPTMPAQYYDFGLEGHMKYMRNSGHRMSYIRNFGQKLGGKGTTLLDLMRERALGEYSKSQVDDIIRGIERYPGERTKWDRERSFVRNVTTMNMLANPRSAINDLMSAYASSASFGGPMNTLEGAAKSLGNIDDVVEAGVVKEHMQNLGQDADLLDDQNTWDQKVLDFGLKWLSGRSPGDTNTRVGAFRTGQAWLRSALEQYGKNPRSTKSLNNAAFVKRMGIDPIKLMAEDGTPKGELTQRFLREFVGATQHTYTTGRTMGVANSPSTNAMFLFTKFLTQNLNTFRKHVVDPAMQRVHLKNETVPVLNKETGETENVRIPGSLAPAFKYFLINSLVGAANEELFYWALGLPRTGASPQEIATAFMKADPIVIKWVLEKLWVYNLNMGATGLLFNGLDRAGRFSRSLDPKDLFNPAAASQGAGIYDFAVGVAKQGITNTGMSDVDRLLKSSSLYRFGRAVGARAADFGFDHRASKVEAARQDVRQLAGQMKRFADKSGLKIDMPSSIRDRGPDTTYHNNVKDALLIGDTDEARRLQKEHNKELTPEQVTAANKSLRASVSKGEPMRIAGYKSADAVREFKKYSKEYLSKADQLTNERLQNTYISSANKLNLYGSEESRQATLKELIKKHPTGVMQYVTPSYY